MRRAGRITDAQRRALETLWPRYGVEPTDILSLEDVFGRTAPRVLEIGFGMGDNLVEMAARDRGQDVLGIEVHDAGIGRVMHRARELGLTNLRILRGDAADLVPAILPPDTFEEIWILFPDPWPKKRHHKRRLIQPGFAADVVSRIRPGGRLLLATDWEDYARHIAEVLQSIEGLENRAGPSVFSADTAERSPTRFEQRGRRLGHEIWNLEFRRIGEDREPPRGAGRPES